MRPTIEDDNTLERDMKTGAVLKKNGTGLLAAKTKKQKIKEDAERLSNLEARVNHINTQLDEVTNLLKQLLNR